MIRLSLTAALAVALAAPTPTRGQQTDPGGDATRPALRAALAAARIAVDGRLDEAEWGRAERATAFTQRQPDEGEPATERTEVRVVYGRDAVYVGARMYDRAPVSTRLGRRDSSLPGSDWITILFDSYHDHLTAYQFSVNPSGVRRDIFLAGDFDEDESWDPVWEAATHIDGEGWTAELRIPFSQLRYRADAAQTWGLQITREISRTNEESWFAFTPKRERAGIPRYGHLDGLAGLRGAERLELLPYALTRAYYHDIGRNSDLTFPNPYSDGSDYTTTGGVDLKYRVASNLTLDATLNPDFGQVESDPAVINLTAFETQFEERRPFFVEGADIFSFGGGGFGGGSQLFYSRRIGAAPPGRLPSERVYADVPDHATILGAAKLSGKLHGWSLGVVDGVTAREHADYITEDRTPARAEVSPVSNFFAARGRRELREGQTLVGAIVTAVHRRLGDDALAEQLRSAAYAAGVDFTHEWADRAWSVSGFLSASHIRGEPAVLVNAQRSSARYYQRPDARHLTLDSARTSLGGWSGRIELEKEAGEHWRGDLSFSTVSPGYETNDLGFQSRADQHSAFARLVYVDEEPGPVFREWNTELQPSVSWNWDGDRIGSSLDFESSFEWLNYWVTDIEASYGFAALDDRLTRGGPLARSPASSSVALSIESDSRKSWTIDAGIDYGTGEAGSSTSVDVELGFRPADNWNLSITPEWSRDRSTAQYLTAVTDTLAHATYGRRYLFAGLTEHELSLALRTNVTLTPELTFELYARPFFGNGRFTPPTELAAPRSFRFLRYDRIGNIERTGDGWEIDPDGPGPARSFEVDDEAFSFRSLRGNAVLRWQWRPGSTLFLVWQQERETETAYDELRLGSEFRRLGRIAPRNVFMLKVSYWLNL